MYKRRVYLTNMITANYQETMIKSWGNSYGLSLSKRLLKAAGLTKNTPVRITVTEEGLIVKPCHKSTESGFINPYSENDLLKNLDAYNAHADELPSLLSNEMGDD